MNRRSTRPSRGFGRERTEERDLRGSEVSCGSRGAEEDKRGGERPDLENGVRPSSARERRSMED